MQNHFDTFFCLCVCLFLYVLYTIHLSQGRYRGKYLKGAKIPWRSWGQSPMVGVSPMKWRLFSCFVLITPMHEDTPKLLIFPFSDIHLAPPPHGATPGLSASPPPLFVDPMIRIILLILSRSFKAYI